MINKMNPNQCSSVGSSKISESISSTDSIATSLSSTGSVDASTTNLSTPNLNVTSQSASPAGDTVAGLHGVHLSSHGHGHSRGHGHYGHGLGHGPVHSVPSFGPRPLNGSSRRQLVHSVSIIVEPVPDGDDDTLADVGIERPSISNERRNTIAGPIIFEDFQFEPPRKASQDDDIVQSIIANARLRKEEFAKLLEEHAQIVSEINRAETKLL